MMKRDQCLQALAEHVGATDIVVPAYQAAFEWLVIRPSDLNYLCTGAMGQAASHALGLALGFPGRRVIVLDGDGSLLMNLGALVTIAGRAPANLYHFVCENGVYEANGSHPIPAAGTVDFAALAHAAGYAGTHRYSELDVFARDAGGLLARTGPLFVDLRVEQGEVYPQDYTELHSAERRERFRAAVRR